MANTPAKRKKKLKERSIFSSIRKPVAPPGHPLTQAKPDERARPARRKAKHKQPAATRVSVSEPED